MILATCSASTSASDWSNVAIGLTAVLGVYFSWRANRRAARAHARLDDAGAADTPERMRRGRLYERALYPTGEPEPVRGTTS